MKYLKLAIAMMLTACGTTMQTTTESSFTEQEYKRAKEVNDFALKLFHEVYKGAAQNDNFCVSPMSASWALSMAANGAASETAEQIYSVLGFDADSTLQANLYQQKVANRMASLDPEKVTVGIANSVWINENFKAKREFIEKNGAYYGATVKNVAFDAAAVKEINGWCKEKTSGKIGEIIKEIDPMTQMYLINALYFNGRWGSIFSKSRTKEELFTKEDGTKIKVQMMHQKSNAQYYEDENVQMMAKPFGRGVFSMYFILPREGVTMKDAATEIALNFAAWCEKSGRHEVDLSLPRFKAEYGTSLKTVLQTLGMKDAFNPTRADFSGISKEPLCIGDVMQKTFIRVDEEGAEAAAVTSVSMMAMSMAPPTPKTMRIDRPFFYVIRENGSGNILFIGKNGEPKE